LVVNVLWRSASLFGGELVLLAAALSIWRSRGKETRWLFVAAEVLIGFGLIELWRFWPF
jgi:hypothetical protein